MPKYSFKTEIYADLAAYDVRVASRPSNERVE